MYKNTLIISLLLLATFQSNYAGRTSGRAASYTAGRRNYYGQQEQATQTPAQTPKEYLDDKSGFSTFGIIMIIFAVILCCLIFYYSIMCYPFLCREEKKFPYLDVSTITAATSRSIQSIENYPVDQKP